MNLRCPVEMSVCLETTHPFHTATASALMTSMLTLSRQGYGWLPEGNLISSILTFNLLLLDSMDKIYLMMPLFSFSVFFRFLAFALIFCDQLLMSCWMFLGCPVKIHSIFV